jgi:hypothetical protein
MRFDHSLTAGGIVSGSLERVRVRNSAKHWQRMVLAGTCQLKNKSPLAAIDSVDPCNPRSCAGPQSLAGQPEPGQSAKSLTERLHTGAVRLYITDQPRSPNRNSYK